VNDIKEILLKSLKGQLTNSEQLELDHWLNLDPSNRELYERLNNPEAIASALQMMQQVNEEAAWQKISGLTQPAPVLSVVKSARFRWIKYAAAVVIIAAGAGTFYFSQRAYKVESSASDQATIRENDVQPGTTGAVLTLSDGSKISLDSAGSGTVAAQGNTQVVKLSDGRLAYQVKGSQANILFNTLSTDRGKQFQVVLPDGTKVWLNAASSITYPTAFIGKTRRVRMTGEAYFEVAKNAAMPFVVETPGQETTALGTSFNINSYEDEEKVRTTLLEGSVRISHSSAHQLLRPGQQSVIGKEPGDMLVKEADVQQAIAWKNGYFSFTNADLKVIMRQLSRWYNVDVIYEGEGPKVEFSGEIGRTLTLAQLLDILKETRIRYRIENKKLIIMS
jgi:ferric-dicitrate binding protein FerR (iron transport regulator)